jgi:hypothetical protein
MFSNARKLLTAACASAAIMTTMPAAADGGRSYQVTITNLTHAINFTPILVASHRDGVSIFEPGSAASTDLQRVAEGGDIAPMSATLLANPRVKDVQNSGGLLGPGQSVSVTVKAGYRASHISLASMLLPTNDGFFGLSDVQAPWFGSVTYYSPGYDAGTETNDELCVSIPGPTCGGEAFSPNDDGEGYVHVHRSIHGIGDLAADVYDWRNPVAKITITRIE